MTATATAFTVVFAWWYIPIALCLLALLIVWWAWRNIEKWNPPLAVLVGMTFFIAGALATFIGWLASIGWVAS